MVTRKATDAACFMMSLSCPGPGWIRQTELVQRAYLPPSSRCHSESRRSAPGPWTNRTAPALRIAGDAWYHARVSEPTAGELAELARRAQAGEGAARDQLL